MRDTPQNIVDEIRVAERMCASLKGDQWREAYKPIIEAAARIQALIDAAREEGRKEGEAAAYEDAAKTVGRKGYGPNEWGSGILASLVQELRTKAYEVK